MVDERAIAEQYGALRGELDERRRRLWAASQARALGRGGIAAVARATGLSPETLRDVLCELGPPAARASAADDPWLVFVPGARLYGKHTGGRCSRATPLLCAGSRLLGKTDG